MHTSGDDEILARAAEEDRVVVSADSDFSTILATIEAGRPSFILFREPNLFIARDYADRLLSVLPLLEPALTAGCVAVSDEVVCGSVGCLFRDNAGKKGPVNLTHNACRAD
jgi:predicted nuclease of predicted toxin-antitoxin system